MEMEVRKEGFAFSFSCFAPVSSKFDQNEISHCNIDTYSISQVRRIKNCTDAR